MKAITILAAAFIGTFIGTSIGIAQAASETTVTVTAPEPRTAHRVAHDVTALAKVDTHLAPAKAPRAVTGGHARPKATVCSVETLTQGSGTVRYCRAK